MIAGLLIMPYSIGIADVGGEGTDYLLGPQDKIRVRVFEWRASRDEIFEWSSFNAEYVVGAGGNISLPLVGNVAAGGKSSSELASAIGKALKARINLAELPDISIEVTQFRPFYILGDVERPGEYAFRPGLTVLQAIAVAGGLMRNNDMSALRLEREAISTKGALALLEKDMMATLLRQARLESERDGLDEIAVPKQFQLAASGSTMAKIVEQETQLFQSRKDAFATQVLALEQLRSLHEEEAASLVKQLDAHKIFSELVDEELQGVMQLYKQKLATAPRKLALERNSAQLQGDRIRLETSLAKARQEAGKTEITILDLRNKRRIEIADELRKAQTKADEVGNNLQTSEELLVDTEVTTPLVMGAQARKKQSVLTIVRQVDGQAIELVASETTRLEPGDTIKIEAPDPESARAELSKGLRHGRPLPAKGYTSAVTRPETAAGGIRH